MDVKRESGRSHRKSNARSRPAGWPGKNSPRPAHRVSRALLNVVNDERGRWVLGQHPEHRSELRLSALHGGRVRRFVLDRTFVTQDGTRWIVDYKVGAHEGADVEAFLDAEHMRYRGQLEAYGAALDPTGSARPVLPAGARLAAVVAAIQRRLSRRIGEPLSPADIILNGGPPRTEVP